MDYSHDTTTKSDESFTGGESNSPPFGYFFSPLLELTTQFTSEALSPSSDVSSDVETGPVSGLFPFFPLSGMQSSDDMHVDPVFDTKPITYNPPRHTPKVGIHPSDIQRRYNHSPHHYKSSESLERRSAKIRRTTGPSPFTIPSTRPAIFTHDTQPSTHAPPMHTPLPETTTTVIEPNGMMASSAAEPPPAVSQYAPSAPPEVPVTMDRGPMLDGSSSLDFDINDEQESSPLPGNADGTPSLIVECQPPIEVRTRTPSEKRNFSCSVQLGGAWKEIGAKFVTVELLYAPQCREDGEVVRYEAPHTTFSTQFLTPTQPKQNILGGTKTVTIKSNGSAVFDNLSMSEASTKHKEKEFCLKFTLLDKNGNKLPFSVTSNSFYAFSNTKVLSRRRDITLRTLSKNVGPTTGGEIMHVIGSPFIRGPSLKLVFRTPHGEITASGLELYSETVLFFTLPAYPYPVPNGQDEIKCQVVVTNDGRNYSNPLDFIYVPPRKALRSYL